MAARRSYVGIWTRKWEDSTMNTRLSAQKWSVDTNLCAFANMHMLETF